MAQDFISAPLIFCFVLIYYGLYVSVQTAFLNINGYIAVLMASEAITSIKECCFKNIVEAQIARDMPTKAARQAVPLNLGIFQAVKHTAIVPIT